MLSGKCVILNTCVSMEDLLWKISFLCVEFSLRFFPTITHVFFVLFGFIKTCSCDVKRLFRTKKNFETEFWKIS